MGLKRHALKTRKVIDQIIEKPFQEAKLKKVDFQCLSLWTACLNAIAFKDRWRVNLLHGRGLT